MAIQPDLLAAHAYCVMAGPDPAIQVTLKDMRFLLLDGPIKPGHDLGEFVGCPETAERPDDSRRLTVQFFRTVRPGGILVTPGMVNFGSVNGLARDDFCLRIPTMFL